MDSPVISVHMLSWINARLREQAELEARIRRSKQWNFPRFELGDVLRVTTVLAAMFGGISLMACQTCIR